MASPLQLPALIAFRNFDELFGRATSAEDHNSPPRDAYPFQIRFAESTELPTLVRIPTGLGKTAMAVLGWLWRRRFAEPEVRNKTPRRLVYCLPMRVLVEQTRRAVAEWLDRVGLAKDIGVYVLMGGEDVDDWDLYPERDAILIGTQDMLLSRALNRGYGMSRYRWPMHFALLNNDCLWILDEVQLMGAGLATTTQLQGLRAASPGLGTCGAVQSIWMSATLERDWLKTVDFDSGKLGTPLELAADDFENQSILDRYHAPKIVSKADAASDDTKALAVEVIEHHRQGTRTLVVVNTVARARLLYTEIGRRKSAAKLVLIHSRFRPPDRKSKIEQLLAEPGPSGMIVVSTQVVEAGVDVSAKTLFTELAPWASLVQRFGRCNRTGEFTRADAAQIVWIDIDTSADGGKKSAPPYSTEELERSREHLEKLNGNSAAPATIETLNVSLPFSHTHVIRKKDVVELFDTTPDLAGNDLDIDRYVRDVDESDVQVFWRNLSGAPPAAKECLPLREELCTAPIGEFRRFLESAVKAKHLKLSRAHRRNYLERKWEAVGKNEIFSGQAYMLDSQFGGYSPERGWTGEIAKATEPPVTVVPRNSVNCRDDDGDEAEPLSEQFWRKLSEHTDDVCRELDAILSHFNLEYEEVLRTAARWHDWGKAHQVFRVALPTGAPESDATWAKAKGRWQRYSRRHFRHELASALGFLQIDSSRVSDSVRDLAAYLIAAHHGKVRLSIRSMPGETAPSGLRFARGVRDEDPLPSVDLGGGVLAPAVVLSLELMELGTSANGNPSWTERTLKLRNQFGPFRLAFFEALLRAADMRASSMNPTSGAAQ